MHLRIVSRMWYFSNVPNGAERRKFCKSLIFFWFLYSNQGCRATPILVCSGVRVYPLCVAKTPPQLNLRLVHSKRALDSGEAQWL